MKSDFRKVGQHKRFSFSCLINNFTIIEILVVIIIILILAALLLPVMPTVESKARSAKARAEMVSIVTAIKGYETAYGLYPYISTVDVEWDDLLDGDKNQDPTTEDSKAYDTLLQILSKVNMIAGCDDSVKNMAGTGNFREIRFLDVKSDFPIKGFLDPWENRYVIALDTNYTGNLDGSPGDLPDMSGTVFVYSFGPNGVDDNGVGGGVSDSNGNGENDDDVVSWE